MKDAHNYVDAIELASKIRELLAEYQVDSIQTAHKRLVFRDANGKPINSVESK